ncbi:curli assembly protein CsgF [Oceanicola granulosus]|nr:curli assembly protein CsgF [Oceanicola granulosus]
MGVLVTVSTLMAAGPSTAENLNFGFLNPNFGGDPNLASFLFGLAEAQRTATVASEGDQSQQQAGAPGIGGPAAVGGPTIIIPVNTGGEADVPQVGE